MTKRVKSWWFSLQYTLWFIPAIMTIVALLLANLTLYLDQQVFSGAGLHTWWLFEGGAEGARGVLSTISATMITVATTAFSITIVAIQLGSSQYSPRILHGFTGDRGNQLVLGTFIATFAYTVLVLRSVKSETADQVVFVPSLSVSVSIFMAFGAIGSLIFFFHHATQTIQASAVIGRAFDDTSMLVDRRLRQDERRDQEGVADPLERDDMAPIETGRSGYLTSIDIGQLAKLGGEHELVITIRVNVGMHLLSNTPAAAVPLASMLRMTEEDRDSFRKSVSEAFTLEKERTLENDLLLGFRQLSDIAVKALSPGVNDPTTAITAIDRMGEAILKMRETRQETWYLAGPKGHGGLRMTSVGLEQVLDESIPQIRHFGASDVIVVVQLLGVLAGIADGASDETKQLLVEQAREIVDESVATMPLENDRVRVRQAATWATG